MRAYSVAFFLGMTVIGGAARAAEDQAPIMRCIVASGSLAASQDPAMAQVGAMSGLFWLGRVDPKISEADLEQSLSAVFAAMTPAQVAPEFDRCRKEMKDRSDLVSRVGARIQERAAKAATH